MNTIAIIGNFGPEHSTENELAKAWAANGWVTTLVQEDDPAAWEALTRALWAHDLITWTRTASLCPDHDTQRRLIEADMRPPLVGIHLDRWWGLRRERELSTEPYFSGVDVLYTADGGHEDRWDEIGVTHGWMPPAVTSGACVGGTARPELTSPLAFVGSWGSGYHPEWGHRADLVRYLRRRGDVAFWPRAGEPAVRGRALADLYASVGLAVGDSCLVPDADGTPAERYWSDRVPETLGRGCLLVHPWVEGIDAAFPEMPTWPLGDWDALDALLDALLGDPASVEDYAAACRAAVIEAHTYEVRVRQIALDLEERGLL